MYTDQDIAELYQAAKKKAEVEAIKSVVNQLRDSEESAKYACPKCSVWGCNCDSPLAKDGKDKYGPYRFPVRVGSDSYTITVEPGLTCVVTITNNCSTRERQICFDSNKVYELLHDFLNA